MAAWELSTFLLVVSTLPWLWLPGGHQDSVTTECSAQVSTGALTAIGVESPLPDAISLKEFLNTWRGAQGLEVSPQTLGFQNSGPDGSQN